MVLVATQVKRRRGTTAENDAFTGAEGEITVDTEKHELRVHDGMTQGGFKIGGGYRPDLFDHKWADHQLNDVSWLRADTFSWQSGDVYAAAYEHLVDDIGGKTLQSETISDTTIQFYLADDGHKICLASEESNVSAIYNSTGVAWYYILDTTNRQFKLPRTKWGFTGLRDSVGGYVPQNVLLPNITGYASFSADGSSDYLTGIVSTNGALYSTTDVSSSHGAGGGGNHSGAKRLRLDASRSSSVYSGNGTNTLIQPRSTQMYLYFYVGNFTQTALENTAGLNAEMFNDLNAHKVIEFQVPTASNGYTWYRKYADGWVEQGGIVFPTTSTLTRVHVALPITMGNNVYSVQVTCGDDTADAARFSYYTNRTTTGFDILYSHTTSSYTIGDSWQVSGMSAQ